MKKLIRLLILLFIIFALLSSCISNSNSNMRFTFDVNGSYTGFNNLSQNYTVEDAENDSCVIRAPLGIAANQKVWYRFIQNSKRGIDSYVRLAYFNDDIASPYFTDLFFNDGSYYLFDSTADSLIKQSYKYLLTLDGKFGNPLRDSTVIILTDDKYLTFEVVMKSMFSSSMDYINRVSDFKLIMFQ